MIDLSQAAGYRLAIQTSIGKDIAMIDVEPFVAAW